ncbi:MAG: ribulose-phosphate 3-epimerase [Lactobacillus sp.]|jgi:ribulose-phosphate 3-epimerase|nr:ribulose-phosphate 3-epimerase [Lactobacillus sp.]
MNKKESKISASLMCTNPFFTKETMDSLEKANIEYMHLDIMDGKFVPNLGLGCDYIKKLRGYTKIPFDYHLMVLEPDAILPLLDIKPEDLVSIHFESTFQVQRTLENVKKYGPKVMLAINPATPVSALEEVIHYIDGINILTVNPGFAGQPIVESSFRKIEKLFNFLKEVGREDIDVEVDGNITFKNANILKGMGANIFVAGTSSIFGKEGIIEGSIEKLRDAISGNSSVDKMIA